MRSSVYVRCPAPLAAPTSLSSHAKPKWHAAISRLRRSTLRLPPAGRDACSWRSVAGRKLRPATGPSPIASGTRNASVTSLSSARGWLACSGPAMAPSSLSQLEVHRLCSAVLVAVRDASQAALGPSPALQCWEDPALSPCVALASIGKLWPSDLLLSQYAIDTYTALDLR